jgi:YHS domain-containing protein
MVGVVLVLAVAAVALFFSLDDNRSGEIDVVAVNTLSSDVAIRGHDPAAYFTEGRPVMGDPAYQMSYGDALYQFASAEHLAMFQENPEAYVPAYGGYCSYGVRMGMKYDIDPTAFEIVDGQLYLQLDPGTRHVWLQDMMENIVIADGVWNDIREVKPDALPLSM